MLIHAKFFGKRLNMTFHPVKEKVLPAELIWHPLCSQEIQLYLY